MGNAGFKKSLNPKTPIDPLKEPLKGTLIDPFEGTPGFYISLRHEVCFIRAGEVLFHCPSLRSKSGSGQLRVRVWGLGFRA